MVRELLLKRLANVTRCTKGYGGAFVGVPLKYFNLIRKTMKHVMKQFIRCKCDYSSTKDICNSFCGPDSGKWQTFLFFIFVSVSCLEFNSCCFVAVSLHEFSRKICFQFLFCFCFSVFKFHFLPPPPSFKGGRGNLTLTECVFSTFEETLSYFLRKLHSTVD